MDDCCKNCRYSEIQYLGSARQLLCRKRAPAIAVYPDSTFMGQPHGATLWPVMADDQWCGEFEKEPGQ